MKTVFLLFSFVLFLLAAEPYPCDAPLEVNSERECLLERSLDQNISLEEAIDDAITDIDIDEDTDRAVEIGDDGNTTGFESYLQHLDLFHGYVSHKVHVISSNIDRELSERIDSFDDNETEAAEKQQKKLAYTKDLNGTESESMSEQFDRFFNDDTYLDANNISFMMIRLGFRYDYKGENEFINKVRFSLKLPKSGDQLNIFFGDSDDEVNTINNAGRPEETATLGLRYFAPSGIDGLKSSFSAGIRGLDNPYVRARFEYPLIYDDLFIRPIQYFRYALEEEFEEKTDLFFDLKSAEDQMIRWHLQRETVHDRPGMLFYAGLIHLQSFNEDDALQTYISLAGATKNDIDPALVDFEPQNGINSYSVGALWRQRIFRKYLFFDIGPTILFAQAYHYKADPILTFNFEFYFGNI